MKLLKKQINEKDGEGSVTLRAEEPEDMWHVYNLIHHHDSVRTTTIRKVIKEGVTGSTTSQRVRMTLKIDVEDVQFDPVLCVLRIRGRNVAENAHVRMGAYHTLDLELNRDFTLFKPMWDAMSLERLETACDISKQADVAAVVMQTGLAHVCLIKGHMTVVRAKIQVNIPRKRAGASGHGKAVDKFYEAIYQAIKRHVDFDLVKCLLLASPGYVKDDCYKYICAEAARRDDKTILENKPKVVLCHASSGHKHALDEVLATSKELQSRMNDTKAMEDVKALGNFFEMLHTQPDRAYYGYKHVVYANENLAIEELLIVDGLFRSQDIKTRLKYVKLVEAARDNGATVRVFSSLHLSGEQLTQLSGVAAILRFPLPELEEDDEDEAEFDPEEESGLIVREDPEDLDEESLMA